MNYRPKLRHLPSWDTIEALICLENALVYGLQREVCEHHQSVIHQLFVACLELATGDRKNCCEHSGDLEPRWGGEAKNFSSKHILVWICVLVSSEGHRELDASLQVREGKSCVPACSSSFLSSLAVDSAISFGLCSSFSWVWEKIVLYMKSEKTVSVPILVFVTSANY